MTSVRRAPFALRSTQALALAGLAAYAAQAALAVCGESATAFFETYVYATLIALGGALCLARAATERHERLPWLVLGAGLIAWVGGEVYYSAVLEDMLAPPLPSVADALWLAFYPCCYVALVLLVRARVREFHSSLWLDGVVGALAAAALGCALVFGALTAGGVDATIVAVDLSYFLGDLLLLGFVIGVLAVTGWRPGRAFTVLTAGLATSALADGFFLHQAATGATGGSTIMATFWPASAVLVGCAAWVRTGSQVRIRLSGWRVLVMPIIFALVAVSLLVLHAINSLNGAALGFAVATLMAVIVRLALTFRENLQLLEGTRRQALTDALTGLANRRKLMDDLNAAAAAASPDNPQGLLLFDLDGFKQYNDRYGHPVGDALLARLGRRLDATVRPTGRAYRLGGDEFAVIAPGETDELVELAARARDALSEQGRGFEVTSSCGIVQLPAEAEDVTHALHIADERLYAEKGGRNRTTLSKETSAALLRVLKERQPTLRHPLGEVAQLALALGERLGLDKAQLDELGRAAELHDIGKIAVPEDILSKAGPLDDREWEFVRQHTLVGARILSAAPTLSSVAKVVRASHENFDGSGYPDALVRDEIPLGSRIVAVCDAYHAMTTDRPYRRAVETPDALEELRRCAGQQFDPEVVEAFCDLFTPPAEAEAAPVPRTLAAQAGRSLA